MLIIVSRFPFLRSYLPMQFLHFSLPRFFFRSRIKRFIAFLTIFLYVCTNDWACLVYSQKANPTRKSLFIKKGLARQVVGFVIIKTVENLYTGYMANIQSTSLRFILMLSAIISDYARLQLKKLLWKNLLFQKSQYCERYILILLTFLIFDLLFDSCIININYRYISLF